MKQIFTLLILGFVLVPGKGKSQVLINELYTDPGAGKHEFFELYNSTPGNTSLSMNNFTMITFFDISGQKGFFVMDLPNLSVASKGYFVGSAALPFNYQGVTNCSASDFNWNSAAFTSNQGYIRKWVQGGLNLVDGNLFYDQAALPINFNDFFFRFTGNGASYTVFLYKDGQLINTFAGGTGGQTTITNDIVNMPSLYVDMTGASTDFTINFSSYGSIPMEYCIQDAGSDNGFIRLGDGACYAWDKSSSQRQHTPKAANGPVSGTSGVIAVASAINPGTYATGSVVVYDVVSAPSSVFPVTMEIYLDNGTVTGQLDPSDTYVTSNTETIITQGPFYTTFFPYNANILIVVKSNAGCIDKIQYIPNWKVLGVQLIAFNGEQKKTDIVLNWEVEENEVVDHFEVERSIDGGSFVTVGSVVTTTTEGYENYSYTEKAPLNGRLNYRLKILDNTGKQGYSKHVVFETRPKDQALIIFNNPVKDLLALSFQSAEANKFILNIYDISGRKRINQIVNGNAGKNIISLPLTGIDRGIFLVELNSGSEKHTLKFIKE